MKIGTRLQLSSLAYLLLTVLLGVALLVIYRNIEQANQTHLLTHEIITEVSEIHLYVNNAALADDPYRQLAGLDDSQLQSLLGSSRFGAGFSAELRGAILQDLSSVKMRISGVSTAGPEEVRRELSHMIIDTQSMLSNAIYLAEYTHYAIFQQQQLATFILFCYVALFTVLLVVNTLLNTKHFIDPLNKMQEFMRGVADSNGTGARLEMDTNDEFEELAHTFNEMAEQLEATNKQLSEHNIDQSATLERVEHQNKMLEDAKKAMLNVLEDLSQEKYEVERAKARDEAVLSSIGDGLVLTDSEGTILLVNKGFEELLGWKESEVIGQPATKVMPMVAEDKSLVPWEKRPHPIALFTNKRFSALSDYSYMRKDMTVFPASITVTPVVLDDEVIGAIEIFRDITHEKEIDRAKSEFVSLASHQLRTPLSTIGWYAEMLLAGDAGKISKEQKQYLQEVYDSNQRMVELVNALLNVSRIEMGTFAVDPEPTDFIELCDSVIKELKPMVKEKKLAIDTDYDAAMGEVQADPKLMRIVFQNIISNAVKYTPDKGTISVTIKKRSRDIYIEISDTGYGIPKSQQGKIFTKLFRADNIRDVITDGTGLGLYIAKSIIDSANGKIWFKSKENTGTSFFITLPRGGMKKKKGTKKLEQRQPQ